MSLTIEVLDQIDWRPLDTEPPSDCSRYATHSGVLQLRGLEIRVYRLNTGETVVHSDDFLNFLWGAT
ncbi:MAG: hypothetical protein IAE66_06260 [Xanthomonadaceae bacterium]|nr:hypothetical protein [Xanthomonadaceae bacterium]